MMLIVLALLLFSIFISPSGISGEKIRINQSNTNLFEITLLVHSDNQDRITWTELVATELRNIGIGVDVDISTTFPSRVWEHPSCLVDNCTSIPIYDEGGFDLLFIGTYSQPHEWGLFRTGANGEDGYYTYSRKSDFYDWPSTSNTTILDLYNEYYNTTDTNIQQELVKDMQLYFYQDLPARSI
ncbi:MAG: hypothetical protein ACW98K_06870 [Candidatus Kariarchaeaceae archaeon]